MDSSGYISGYRIYRRLHKAILRIPLVTAEVVQTMVDQFPDRTARSDNLDDDEAVEFDPRIMTELIIVCKCEHATMVTPIKAQRQAQRPLPTLPPGCEPPKRAFLFSEDPAREIEVMSKLVTNILNGTVFFDCNNLDVRLKQRVAIERLDDALEQTMIRRKRKVEERSARDFLEPCIKDHPDVIEDGSTCYCFECGMALTLKIDQLIATRDPNKWMEWILGYIAPARIAPAAEGQESDEEKEETSPYLQNLINLAQRCDRRFRAGVEPSDDIRARARALALEWQAALAETKDGGRIELLNSLKGKQPMTPQVFVSWLSELKFYDPRLRLLYSVVNVPRPAVERRDSTGCKASAYVNPWAVWQDR